MTEAELLDNVIALAHLFKWRCAHFRPAMTKHGWRTPVSADGKGWPDLVLTRQGQLIFAELKSARGKVAPEQAEWLDELKLIAPTFVWKPADWTAGVIERALR